MARNRTESVLGLPPLRRQSGFETAMSLALLGNNRDINERERGIYANLHEQEVVIDALSTKTIFGMEKMNEVKRAAATDVLYTYQYIEELKTGAGLSQPQAAYDEFVTRLYALSGRHTLGAVEVSATLIANEISASLYPPEPEPEEEVPEPEPPKSFLQRLLGG